MASTPRVPRTEPPLTATALCNSGAERSQTLRLATGGSKSKPTHTRSFQTMDVQLDCTVVSAARVSQELKELIENGKGLPI